MANKMVSKSTLRAACIPIIRSVSKLSARLVFSLHRHHTSHGFNRITSSAIGWRHLWLQFLHVCLICSFWFGDVYLGQETYRQPCCRDYFRNCLCFLAISNGTFPHWTSEFIWDSVVPFFFYGIN